MLTFAIVSVKAGTDFFSLIMAIFYFSRDLALLVPLSLAREIIGAKFITVVIQEYLTVLPFMLPALYFMVQGLERPVLWLVGALITLIPPIIP